MKFVFVQLLFSIFCGSLFADKSADAPSEPTKILVDLKLLSPGTFGATVEVGDLSVGQREDLVLELKNSSDQEIFLGDPTASCSCLRVSLSDRTIRSGETVQALVAVKVPDVKSPTWMQRITFHDEAKEQAAIVRLDLVSNVQGVLAIEPANIVLYCEDEPADSESFLDSSVEVVTSLPVQFSDLKLQGQTDINLLSVEKKIIDETHGRIDLRLKRGDVPEGGLTWPVRLFDPETERQARFVFTVVRRPKLQLAPSTLRFRKENKQLIANVMIIRYSEGKNSFHCDAKLGEIAGKVQSLNVGKKIARFQLAFHLGDHTLEELRDRKLSLVVSWADKKVHLQPKVLLPNH